MTPTHAAASQVVRESVAMIVDALDGLPDAAAEWTPAPNTNSIAVLTAHAASSTRFWLANGAGAVSSIRHYRADDRAPSFETHGKSIAALRELIQALPADAEAILAKGTEADLTTVVAWPDEDPGEPPRTGAHCIVHAAGHLREHVGQVQLMRDLWLARG
jgi:uncharacterized damage-inducible protein DinB